MPVVFRSACFSSMDQWIGNIHVAVWWMILFYGMHQNILYLFPIMIFFEKIRHHRLICIGCHRSVYIRRVSHSMDQGSMRIASMTSLIFFSIIQAGHAGVDLPIFYLPSGCDQACLSTCENREPCQYCFQIVEKALSRVSENFLHSIFSLLG